jgi:protein ImuA
LGDGASIEFEVCMSNVSQSNNADLTQSSGSPACDSRTQVVGELRDQLGRWGAANLAEDPAVFSSGAAVVDTLLPGGGLRHGMLVEWLGDFGRSGAVTLGLLAAREACREGGVLVVLDRPQTFYPPAAAAWGIDLNRLIVVRPRNARDELWAAVQALRSPVVAAMWANIERLDARAFRRLQLAAEAGRTLGVLVRPITARGQPSWADVRLEVSPLSVIRGPLHSNHGPRTTDNARLVQVRLTHCHSGRSGAAVALEIDDVSRTVQPMSSTHDTHALPVVAELGDSASHSLPARTKRSAGGAGR